MKIEQLVAVMVRFFVAYLLLVVLFQYGMTLAALIMQNQKIGIAGNGAILTTFAIVVALLVLTWIFAPRVATAMTPKDSGDIKTPLSVEELEVAGFSLIGLWLAVTSIPDLVQYGVYMSMVDAASTRTEVGLYGNIAKCVIGVGLLVGSARLVKFMCSLRGQKGA